MHLLTSEWNSGIRVLWNKSSLPNWNCIPTLSNSSSCDKRNWPIEMPWTLSVGTLTSMARWVIVALCNVSAMIRYVLPTNCQHKWLVTSPVRSVPPIKHCGQKSRRMHRHVRLAWPRNATKGWIIRPRLLLLHSPTTTAMITVSSVTSKWVSWPFLDGWSCLTPAMTSTWLW